MRGADERFMSFDGQTCVIAGAGSPMGIGFSTARILGELGGTVILISTTERIFARVKELEEAKHNVTINNVLPGWIATASQTEEEAADGENTPAGRGGDASEVANAIVFLASREASYITGQDLIVDGGNVLQEYKGPAGLYY